jgi:uncharacterized protein with gpF-like domain
MAPLDPRLAARLRALAAAARAENRIGRVWFRTMGRWLDTVRARVMAPWRTARLPPDPSAVYGEPDAWQRMIDEDVMPEIERTARDAYGQATDEPFDHDAFMSAYLQSAQNRLLGVPDQVYAMITADLERHLTAGTSIDAIAADIETTLTANGVPTWRNRSRTIARTEAIGALNAAAYAGAHAHAAQQGITGMQSIWLATMAGPAALRTRPTHREADGQRVNLGEPFTVGGFPLLYPGDPSGPPQEVINCRCTPLFVTADEAVSMDDRQMIQTPEE